MQTFPVGCLIPAKKKEYNKIIAFGCFPAPNLATFGACVSQQGQK